MGPVQGLRAADKDLRLPACLEAWQTVGLVTLDELGYLDWGPGGPLPFQRCSDRYERGGVMVTTNLELSGRGEVFGSATLTAVPDRLTHPAHVLLSRADPTGPGRVAAGRMWQLRWPAVPL